MIHVRQRLTTGAGRERLRQEAQRAARPMATLLIALVAAFACGAVVLKNLSVAWPWVKQQTVRIGVRDAAGIVAGKQEVRISGVRVGTITEVDLKRSRPVLTLEIGARYGPIYRDARIRVRPQTPLQDLYVDVVDRGHRSAGTLGDGDVLPAARSDVAVDAGRVLDVFNADARERMETATDELARGLGRRGGTELRQAFQELVPFLRAAHDLTRVTAQRARLTRRVVHNLTLLTSELGRRDHQLAGLVRNAAGTLGELASERRPLAATIGVLPGVVAEVRRSFRAVSATLVVADPALTAAHAPALELRRGLGALRDVSAAARPAVRALRAPVRRLGPVAAILRPTADDLATAFARLAPQAPRLERITAAVAHCETAIRGFFQWTPSVFKFSDVNGPSPRGETAAGLHLVRGASCASRTGDEQ